MLHILKYAFTLKNNPWFELLNVRLQPTESKRTHGWMCEVTRSSGVCWLWFGGLRYTQFSSDFLSYSIHRCYLVQACIAPNIATTTTKQNKEKKMSSMDICILSLMSILSLTFIYAYSCYTETIFIVVKLMRLSWKVLILNCLFLFLFLTFNKQLLNVWANCFNFQPLCCCWMNDEQ